MKSARCASCLSMTDFHWLRRLAHNTRYAPFSRVSSVGPAQIQQSSAIIMYVGECLYDYSPVAKALPSDTFVSCYSLKEICTNVSLHPALFLFFLYVQNIRIKDQEFRRMALTD